MTTQIEITFAKERVTKNTIRFIEESDTPVVGTLYVQKSELAKIGNPDHLSVIIKDAFANQREPNGDLKS